MAVPTDATSRSNIAAVIFNSVFSNQVQMMLFMKTFVIVESRLLPLVFHGEEISSAYKKYY